MERVIKGCDCTHAVRSQLAGAGQRETESFTPWLRRPLSHASFGLTLFAANPSEVGSISTSAQREEESKQETGPRATTPEQLLKWAFSTKSLLLVIVSVEQTLGNTGRPFPLCIRACCGAEARRGMATAALWLSPCPATRMAPSAP